MLLSINENGQYRNISFKEAEEIYVEEADTTVKKWLLNGKSVIVTKGDKEFKHDINKGDRSWTSYSCLATYEGEEVSFWLNEREYDAYKVLGAPGSEIKVSGEVLKGNFGNYLSLSFELVE